MEQLLADDNVDSDRNFDGGSGDADDQTTVSADELALEGVDLVDLDNQEKKG